MWYLWSLRISGSNLLKSGTTMSLTKSGYGVFIFISFYFINLYFCVFIVDRKKHLENSKQFLEGGDDHTFLTVVSTLPRVKHCPETVFGGIDGGSSYKWYSHGASDTDEDLQIELRPLSGISCTNPLLAVFDNLVTIPSVITTKMDISGERSVNFTFVSKNSLDLFAFQLCSVLFTSSRVGSLATAPFSKPSHLESIMMKYTVSNFSRFVSPLCLFP